jgi:mono/diheme cytochrome c family protein
VQVERTLYSQISEIRPEESLLVTRESVEGPLSVINVVCGEVREADDESYSFVGDASRAIALVLSDDNLEVGAAQYTAFMTTTLKHSMWLRFFSNARVAVVITATAVVAPGARAQEPRPLSAEDIADGMRLYQQKGNCQACHGWAGDGHKTDSQMPDGANLRETKLNRAGLIMIIKCGRLNSQMPAFDKFAYTDRRCYDKTKADLKAYPTRMPDPPATLQQREIDLVADFLFAKVVGKGPMDHPKCIEFWGSETDACKEFPK